MLNHKQLNLLFLKASLSRSKTPKKPLKTSNFDVNDPKLVVPLIANLSSDSITTTSTGESAANTTLDTSTSEYRPTNFDLADAAAEEEEDQDDLELPNIM